MNEYFNSIIAPLNNELGRFIGIPETFPQTAGRRYITVKDKSTTTKYILCYDQDGNKRFFEASKVRNAEVLGLSVRRVK